MCKSDRVAESPTDANAMAHSNGCRGDAEAALPMLPSEGQASEDKILSTAHRWFQVRPLLYLIGSVIVVLRARVLFAAAPPCPSCVAEEVSCNSKIPKIIHQSYKTSDLPDRWKATPGKWKKVHPDWEYRFWSDEDNRELIRTKYPWFLPTYDSYRHGISRADAARYFVILTYCGVYSDLDVQPLRDMSTLLCKKTEEGHPVGMLVTETPNLGLTNAFFAAEPGNKALKAWTDRLQYQTKFLDGLIPGLPWPSQHFEIMFSAGSSRYSMFMTADEKEAGTTIARIKLGEWGACSLCYSYCPLVAGAFFEHEVGNSWHSYDTMFLNFLSCHPLFVGWLLLCTAVLAFKVHRERRATHYMYDPASASSRLAANCAATSGAPSCYVWIPDALAFAFVVALTGKPL